MDFIFIVATLQMSFKIKFKNIIQNMWLLCQYTKPRVMIFDDKNKIGKQHKTRPQQHDGTVYV